MCACTGHIGTLTENDRKKAMNSRSWTLSASGTRYHSMIENVSETL